VNVAAGVDQREGLDVLDDRLERQPAAVNVGGERAADAEPVGAGLLLDDGPGPFRGGLRAPEVVDQLGPLHTGPDLDLTAVPIEAQHAIEWRGVHVEGAGAELLAAHRMAAAGDADAVAVGPGGADGGPERVDGVGRDDTVDPRGVELRLNVVESRALRRREPPATAGQATDETTGDQELTSCQHGRPMSARGSRSPSARLRT